MADVTLLEDDDLEVLDDDFEIVEVDDGFVVVIKLEGDSVLLLDETDVFKVAELDERVDDFDVAELEDDFKVFAVLDEVNEVVEVVELNEGVDDLVEEVLDKLDDDFNVVEPGSVEDEDNCELDLVPG